VITSGTLGNSIVIPPATNLLNEYHVHGGRLQADDGTDYNTALVR